MPHFSAHQTVSLVTENLTPDRTRDFLAEVQQKGARNALIDSPGGSAYVLRPEVQVLRHRKMTMLAGGYVGSAALTLFLYGAQRYAQPDSTFLFHCCYVRQEERDIHTGEMQQLARIALLNGNVREFQRLNSLLGWMRLMDRLTADSIARATRMSASAVHSLMCRGEVVLNARQAKYYGLVHDIIDLVDM